MTAPDSSEERPPGAEEPPADEEYARTYAAGYEAGLRSALREVLEHAARGHTPLELRALVQGRLARIAEEVDLKRRSLLAPPRPSAWGPLLRPPSAASPRPSTPAGAGTDLLGPGRTVLVREQRPARALELLRENARRFPRVAVVSLRPPDLGSLPPGQVRLIPVRDGGVPGADRPTLGEVGGRLKEPTEAEGGALVYVDALEAFASEEGAEMTIKFVHWLVDQVQRTRSALLVSLDARALDVKDASRLERPFAQIVGPL